MSRRITSKTEMTQAAHVLTAARKIGVSVSHDGNTIRFQSGPLRGARLNLKTGEMSGDSDFGHDEDILGSLRQSYAEALVRHEAIKQGAECSESVKEGQDIVFYMMVG